MQQQQYEEDEDEDEEDDDDEVTAPFRLYRGRWLCSGAGSSWVPVRAVQAPNLCMACLCHI